MSETIINSIDVSECKYLNKVVNEEPYCNIDEEHLYTCSSDENCYFKQLKRMQAENEELKEENNLYKNSIVANHDRAIGKRFAELLEENEELGKALEEIREICKSVKFPLMSKIINIIDEVLR